MRGKGRGRRLTDSERMEIITSLEDPSSTNSKANCARQYGVTPAAISKLMKVSQVVKKRYSDAGSDSGGVREKRQRGGFIKNVPFEDELYQWICSVRARKIPLLVSHVQQKAKLLASRHKTSNQTFKASNGWYYRFCGRYGLTPASLHAGASTPLNGPLNGGQGTPESPQEKSSKDESDWTNVRTKVMQFGPEYVYTLREMRLFYQALPQVITVASESDRASAVAETNGIQRTTDTIDADTAETMEKNAATWSPGKMARILVLVCANGTGTHKIPLLIIGKERMPPCLAEFYPHLVRDGSTNERSTATTIHKIMNVSYYSQREVWCEGHTFKHWCERVFLPAVRERTTQPVLIVCENPGGRLAEFQHDHVSTLFLPVRTPNARDGASLERNSPAPIADLNIIATVHVQPLPNAVIRDLKRRFKVYLFQERLNFLGATKEEKYRLSQYAARKQPGSTGVAFGRAPHLLDAMSLLDEAWAATPSSVIRNGWHMSDLGSNSLLSSSPPVDLYDQSDNAIVMELCCMIRNMHLADDMNIVANELRQWLYIDDDASEQMQQELLYDIQQLLTEEEQQQDSNEDMPGQHQHPTAAFMDISGLPPSFANPPGSYVYRSTDNRSASVLPVDSSAALEEKQKSIGLVLQALAGAEEALNNSDVAEFFGEAVTGETMESISRARRKLRRIQRGKQSALVSVAVNAAANGHVDDRTAGALSTHEYVYGNCALGKSTFTL